MTIKNRLTKAEKTRKQWRNGPIETGVTYETTPNEVTVNGATITRTNWDRLYPDGTLITVRYRDDGPIAPRVWGKTWQQQTPLS